MPPTHHEREHHHHLRNIEPCPRATSGSPRGPRSRQREDNAGNTATKRDNHERYVLETLMMTETSVSISCEFFSHPDCIIGLSPRNSNDSSNAAKMSPPIIQPGYQEIGPFLPWRQSARLKCQNKLYRFSLSLKRRVREKWQRRARQIRREINDLLSSSALKVRCIRRPPAHCRRQSVVRTHAGQLLLLLP